MKKMQWLFEQPNNHAREKIRERDWRLDPLLVAEAHSRALTVYRQTRIDSWMFVYDMGSFSEKE